MSSRREKSLSGLTFVAFDIETTGLDSLTDRIVEVAALRFDLDGIQGRYEQLLNPGCPIPPSVSTIHGITEEVVAGAPSVGSVLPDIVTFFGESVLLAHNAQFDVSFFDAAFQEAAVEPPSNPVVCTRDLARGVVPGLPSYKLTALAATLGIPVREHHRALSDASCCAEIFRHCVGRIDLTWHITLGDLLARYGPAFRFAATSTTMLERMKKALEHGKPVRIRYRAAGGNVTQREITPLSIEGYGGRTKIVAFCHLRGEKRSFRLDCIKEIL